MSPKQKAVISYLNTGERYITLDVAVKLIGSNLYTNAKFHVGNVLGNMVKRGMLRRLKPAVFALPEKKGDLL